MRCFAKMCRDMKAHTVNVLPAETLSSDLPTEHRRDDTLPA